MTDNPPVHWTETLRALSHELDEKHRYCVEQAASDAQVLRNYAALAEFANPTKMPPLGRFLPRRSAPTLIVDLWPASLYTPPQGVPATRNPVGRFRGRPRD